MTRGEIRIHVRDILGESIPGTWQDDELNRYIHLEMCRHAQEAMSVPMERMTSSLHGVTEYALPPDYGEMRSVRFCDYNSRPRPLPYIRKDVLLNRGNELTVIGIPRAYYIYNDYMGLWPAPSKGPLLVYEAEDYIRWFDVIYDTESRLNYAALPEYSIEDLADPTNESLETVYMSHMELHFRRMGPPMRGKVWLTLQRPDCPPVQSMALEASTIKAIPDRIAFDFSADPIEITADEVVHTLTIHTDDDYDNFVTEEDCRGIEVAVDSDTDGQPWFRLHQVKNDIAIDYYKNTVPEPLDDDETLEIPDRYRNCLIEQTLEKCVQQRWD